MRGNILIDSETNNCFRRRVERRPPTFVSLAFLSSNDFLKRILRSQLPVIECLTDLWSVVCLQPFVWMNVAFIASVCHLG